MSIDTDHSGDISLEEILKYLRSVSDEVEEEYVKTIFMQLDANHNQKVSIEEFLAGYLAHVNELAKSISLLKGTLQTKVGEREKLIEQLAVAKTTEKKNAWGVMEGSKLIVRVLEAQRLDSKSGKPNAYVEVMCERQHIQTSVVSANRSPSWIETFEFGVQIGNGEVLCNVMHQGKEPEFLGKCSVMLGELKDQQAVIKWMPLLNDRGQETQGRLQLALQWIHTETALLESQISASSANISNDQAEITRLEAELQRLGTSPLGLFQQDTRFLKLERVLISQVDQFADRHLTVGDISDYQRLGLIEIWKSASVSSAESYPRIRKDGFR